MTLPLARSSGIGSPRRRSAEQIRRQILAAASDRFAAEGYAAAATRRIATQADVAEGLIFRHFISKSGLYRSAVLEPAGAVIRNLGWSNHGADATDTQDPAAGAQAWIAHLLGVVETDRALFIAFLNNGREIVDEPELSAEIRALRRELFSTLDRGAGLAIAVEERTSGLALAVRGVFATVIAVAAYGPMLEIPKRTGGTVRREEVIHLGCAFLLAARGGLSAARES